MDLRRRPPPHPVPMATTNLVLRCQPINSHNNNNNRLQRVVLAVVNLGNNRHRIPWTLLVE